MRSHAEMQSGTGNQTFVGFSALKSQDLNALCLLAIDEHYGVADSLKASNVIRHCFNNILKPKKIDERIQRAMEQRTSLYLGKIFKGGKSS